MPGYVDLMEELNHKFPLSEPQIIGVQSQKDFIALFGTILRMRNLLLSFDEFKGNERISERDLQDYLGRYQDLRDEWKCKRQESTDITDDVVFEIELIRQIEINIDYILMLVKKYHDTHCENKEVRHMEINHNEKIHCDEISGHEKQGMIYRTERKVQKVKKDGILLFFLSEYREGNGPVWYMEEEPDGTERYFEGVQTNDAPVKYLICKAAENGDLIQKVLYIITDRVRSRGDHKKFEQMVDAYIQEDERLRALYEGQKITCEEIAYTDSGQETSVRALKIYRQIAAGSGFRQKTKKNVYIDYTGGFRDISFLMTVIIRYLECHDIFCREIVYSNWNDKKIYSLSCIYDMFRLVSGVDQFVSTGNAELLENCYDKEEDQDTKELLSQIVKFSHVMSLCDVEKVDQIMDNLQKGLDRYEEKKERESFFSEIFSDMISIIRQKLNMEKDQRYTYPRLIRWCLDNNMVQQALTLYVEKIPQYYYESGMLKLPEKERRIKPGATEAGTAFYVELYDSIGKPEELKQFAGRLKQGYEAMERKYRSMDRLDASRFRDLEAFMKTNQEKRAVQRIVYFLRTKYEGNNAVINQPYTRTKIKSRPRTVNGFVKWLLNDIHWQHYFLCQDAKSHEELEAGTYEKKVNALDRLRSREEGIEESNISNEKLYQMMKYYLPLKMIRNRINHASEEGAEEDETNALERLERDHGICARREFAQVKKLMYQGLEILEEHVENT